MSTTTRTRQKLHLSHWLVSTTRPAFGDAQSPSIYGLGTLRSSEDLGFTTALGLRRHLSALVRELQIDGSRIIHREILPSGHVLIVHRPYWQRGPHAAPMGVVVHVTGLDAEDQAEVYRLVVTP